MTDKIIDNGSAGSKLLKFDYPELDIIGVNAASNVEEWFKGLNLNDCKVFLPCNADELRADHEKLRDVIHGLESRGFRNKIVLPYEGMDADTMDKQSRMWRPELKKSIVESYADEQTQDEFILKGDDDIIDPDNEMKSLAGLEGELDRIKDEPTKGKKRNRKV